jgi:hypothetical protein
MNQSLHGFCKQHGLTKSRVYNHLVDLGYDLSQGLTPAALEEAQQAFLDGRGADESDDAAPNFCPARALRRSVCGHDAGGLWGDGAYGVSGTVSAEALFAELMAMGKPQEGAGDADVDGSISP